jgi:hypothetical protein
MKYIVNDLINGKTKVFDTNEEAIAALQQIKADYLEQESYRFTVAREIVDGNNTTWTAVDLDTATEDATYHVFNTLTGQHELVVGVEPAKLRHSQIKEEFLTSNGLDAPTEVTDEEAIKYTPVLTIA